MGSAVEKERGSEVKYAIAYTRWSELSLPRCLWNAECSGLGGLGNLGGW